MCDRDHPQSSDETMSFTHPSPLRIYKDGKTCVFWDVEDYPIPNGLDPASIYQSIKEAIKNQGCHGEMSIHAFADKNTLSDELRRKFSDAGFKFDLFTRGGKYTRHCSMYADIMLWALKNPVPSNVIVLAKIMEYDLAYSIRCLSTSSYYGVLISQAKPEWRFPLGSELLRIESSIEPAIEKRKMIRDKCENGTEIKEGKRSSVMARQRV